MCLVETGRACLSVLAMSNGNPNVPAARVTRPDILVENGVIHLIDRPLFDVQANSDAASSAYVLAASLVSSRGKTDHPRVFVGMHRRRLLQLRLQRIRTLSGRA